MKTVMLERQRLAYLEHLGIDNYVPKYQLVGAATSIQLAKTLLQESGTPLLKETAVVPVTGGSISSKATSLEEDAGGSVDSNADYGDLGRIVDTLTNPSDQHDQPKILAENNDPDTNGDKVSLDVTGSESAQSSHHRTHDDQTEVELKFALTVWRVDDLLVVDSRQPGAALPTDKLLQNVLRSMGYSLAQLPPSELIRWPLFTSNSSPLFTNTSAEQHRLEARAMVRAYISAQCQKQSTRAVLLCGQEAAYFALTSEENTNKHVSSQPFEQTLQQFFTTHQGRVLMPDDKLSERMEYSSRHSLIDSQVAALVIPSLIDMLQGPTKKHIAWKAIEALLSQS